MTTVNYKEFNPYFGSPAINKVLPQNFFIEKHNNGNLSLLERKEPKSDYTLLALNKTEEQIIETLKIVNYIKNGQ